MSADSLFAAGLAMVFMLVTSVASMIFAWKVFQTCTP